MGRVPVQGTKLAYVYDHTAMTLNQLMDKRWNGDCKNGRQETIQWHPHLVNLLTVICDS